MKLLKKILLATDFSPSAESACRMAVSVAREFCSEILLVHVLPEPVISPAYCEDLKPRILERLHEMQRDLEAQDIAVADVAVLYGAPYEQIIRHSDCHDVNVIFLGASRRDRAAVTSERVVRYANRPVWLVHPDTSSVIKKILCPVDLSVPSKRALQNGVHLARNLDAELTVLFVRQPWEGRNPLYSSFYTMPLSAETESRKDEDEALKEFIRSVDFYGTTWTLETRQGKAHEEIIRFARDQMSDLIAIGTVGKSSISRMLVGSVSAKVLSELPCSVITVKAEHAIRVHFEAELADFESHFQAGVQLLEKSFPAEAKTEFEYCLRLNSTSAYAWDQIAVAHERLGNESEAENCRVNAKKLLQSLWEQQVQADIRSRHSVFGNRRGGS